MFSLHIPAYTGPLSSPLLGLLTRVGSTRAGRALNGNNVSPLHLPSTGRLVWAREDISKALGTHRLHRAGKWWVAMGADRTGVLIDSASGRETACAPVALRLARTVTWEGRRFEINPVDITDPLENPRLPHDLAIAIRTSFDQELESWGKWAETAPRLTTTWPAALDRVPAWFSPLCWASPEDITALSRFCLGLAVMGAQGQQDRLPTVIVMGAQLDATGTIHPPRIDVLSGSLPPSLLAEANKALRAPRFFWPPERRIVQGFCARGKSVSMGPQRVASSIQYASPRSAHAGLELAGWARRAITDALGLESTGLSA